MNLLTEYKILEMKVKMLSKKYSQIELLINTFEICILINFLDRFGFIFGFLFSIIINEIIQKTIIPKIKKEQEELKL